MNSITFELHFRPECRDYLAQASRSCQDHQDSGGKYIFVNTYTKESY